MRKEYELFITLPGSGKLLSVGQYDNLDLIEGLSRGLVHGGSVASVELFRRCEYCNGRGEVPTMGGEDGWGECQKCGGLGAYPIDSIKVARRKEA